MDLLLEFMHCSSMRDGASLKFNVHYHIGKNLEKLNNGFKKTLPLDFTQQRNLGTQHTTRVTFIQGFCKGNDKLHGDMQYFWQGGMMAPKMVYFFPYSPTLICPITSLEFMFITINVYFTKSWLLDILY